MKYVRYPQPKGGATVALKSVTLRLPEEVLVHLGQSSRELEQDVAEALVLKLVAEGKVTASYGAEVLGVSYRKMLALMDTHGVPTLNYDPDDLGQELELLQQYPKSD